MSKIVDVHIFSPGTQTSAQGVTREFTKNDLEQVVDSYDPKTHEAPIRVGHEDNDKVPAFGWVKGVKMKGDDLYAEVEFSPQMGGYIKDGLYKKVSASFYAPESKINPEPGNWSLRHVAMLGAQPPAVKGLTGFAYEEQRDGVIDFATGVDLSPEQVFDDELGPTLTVDQQPIEFLKDQLEEARQQMAEEAKREAQDEQELEMALGSDDAATDERPDSDFAEEEGMKKKPSKAKQGAEDTDEEEEGEDTLDNKEVTKAGEGDPADGRDGDMNKINNEKKRGRDSIRSTKVADDKADEDKRFEEVDEAEHKEKMDPVGKEDGDIDNDGDKDSSDEYLAKRRKAIKAAIKGGKKADFAEEDTADHAGCDSKKKNYKEDEESEEYKAGCDSKKKSYKEKYKEDETKHNEISVPEGMDAAQWEAGFKDGVDKFYAAAEAGQDEVVHEEAEDQTEDYLAGIEAGFEFAQGKMANLKDTGFGIDKTGKGKDCHAPESREGKGEDDGRDEKGKGAEADRSKTAKAPAEDRKKVGKGEDCQKDESCETKPMGAPKMGSGKAIKGGNVRVMKFAEADFAELTERLEALEAMNAKLVAEKAAAEKAAHRSQLNDFAESLYATGRLTTAMIDQDELVDYMEGLEYGTLEFAEGESAATKLMEILAALPQQVEFSEVAAHDPEAVPMENLDPHEKALRMSKEEGLSYTEALKQTLFSAE